MFLSYEISIFLTMQKNHKYTLKKEKIECAEKIKPEHFDAAVLPKMVDLRTKMPPIYDQQELGYFISRLIF
jgi:hypothetical protein